MNSKLRRKLSFANVVSLIALFVALGGGAYAAVAAKNTVSSKSIKKGAVKSVDIKNDNIKGIDINETTLIGIDDCPSGAPNRSGDVCFSAILGTGTWDAAIRACANAGLRSPSIGEALLLFRQAPAGETWTDQLGDTNPGNTRTLVIKGAADTGPFTDGSATNHAYRCIATPTG